jgi:PHP family Zn ribbon phosphoesterase
VKTAWNILIEHFGNEVEALIHSEPEDLKIVDKRIVDAILAFRKGNVIIHPGGGGHYGWLELSENLKVEKSESGTKKGSEMKKNDKKFEKKNEELENEETDNSKCQSSLFDF